MISNFLKEFYGGTAYIPKTIYVPNIEDEALLEQWLTLKKESKSTIKIPIKGEKKDILVLVEKNAKTTLENFKIKIFTRKGFI